MRQLLQILLKNGGEIPIEHQGLKAEVADIYQAIKDGLTDTEIMEFYPNEAYNVDKFERIRQKIKSEESATTFRDITTYYIYRKDWSR